MISEITEVAKEDLNIFAQVLIDQHFGSRMSDCTGTYVYKSIVKAKEAYRSCGCTYVSTSSSYVCTCPFVRSVSLSIPSFTVSPCLLLCLILTSSSWSTYLAVCMHAWGFPYLFFLGRRLSRSLTGWLQLRYFYYDVNVWPGLLECVCAKESSLDPLVNWGIKLLPADLLIFQSRIVTLPKLLVMTTLMSNLVSLVYAIPVCMSVRPSGVLGTSE